jgi:hypothetical protein
LTPIIETDELKTVREFCQNQLTVIDRTIDRIRARQASFARKPQLNQSFESLDKSLQDVKTALKGDISLFQKLLQSLAAQLHRSDALLKYATTSEPDFALAKKTSLGAIEYMQQFIQNAEKGCAQRTRLHTFCREQNIEILHLFSQAARDGTLDSPSRGDEKQTEVKRDRRTIRKVATYATPKHIPMSRPKLFEDRRRVSALGIRPQRKTESELMRRSMMNEKNDEYDDQDEIPPD